MRRTDLMNVAVAAAAAACLGTGCATVHEAGGGAPERTSAPMETLQAPPDPSPEARAAFSEAVQYRDAKDWSKALVALDRVLELDPNHFDALHDKSWILSTHPDPAVRNPEEALALAMRASSNLGKWGLLRPERDALPPQTSTGRHILVMSAIAGALAASGHFKSPPPPAGLPEDSAVLAERNALIGKLEEGITSGDAEEVASSLAAQAFVVDATRWLVRQFPQSPDTRPAMERAESLMKLYREGRAPIGQEPVVWSTTGITKLR